LVLLSRAKNAQAQNYDFAIKKSKYFQSPRGTTNFAVTSQVLNTDTWTPEVVERRHADLQYRLIRLWDLGDENAKEATADPEADGVLELFGAGGVHARGRFTNNGQFIVETAVIRAQVRTSMRGNMKDRREELQQKQHLVPDGELLTLTVPQSFKSSSAAAMFVLGYPASGPLMWKSGTTG
jgi:hypothetical protein